MSATPWGNMTQTQDGTYQMGTFGSTASTYDSGGGFNWGAFAASAMKGIGAGLSNVDGTNAYKGLGAGISGGSEWLQSEVGKEQKLDFMEKAAQIENASFEEQEEIRLKAERDEYKSQLERLRKANAAVKFDGDDLLQGRPGSTVGKSMSILSGLRAGDKTETRPKKGTPEPSGGAMSVENARGRQA